MHIMFLLFCFTPSPLQLVTAVRVNKKPYNKITSFYLLTTKNSTFRLTWLVFFFLNNARL